MTEHWDFLAGLLIGVGLSFAAVVFGGLVLLYHWWPL